MKKRWIAEPVVRGTDQPVQNGASYFWTAGGAYRYARRIGVGIAYTWRVRRI